MFCFMWLHVLCVFCSEPDMWRALFQGGEESEKTRRTIVWSHCRVYETGMGREFKAFPLMFQDITDTDIL